MAIAVTTLAITTALLCIIVLGLLRSHAEILRVLHQLGANLEEGHAGGAQLFDLRDGPPRVGAGMAQPSDVPLSIAHDLRGRTPAGDAAALGVTMGGEATLLAFLSSGCEVCGGFWDELRAGSTLSNGLDARVVAVTRGPANESPGRVGELAGDAVLTLMSDDAYEDYQVPVAPYFVLISPSGRVVGEGAAKSWKQLGGLLDRAVADGAVPHADDPSRRDVLAGRLRRQTADDALAAAGVTPRAPEPLRRSECPMTVGVGLVALGVVLAAVAAARGSWSP